MAKSGYDGEIRIDTAIDEAGFGKVIKSMSAKSARLANSVRNTEQELKKLNAEARELAMKKVPTAEYKILSDNLQDANAKFNALLEKQDKMIATGANSGRAWENLNYEMDHLGETIHSTETEMQKLVAAGKAFTLGKDTADYQEKITKIGKLNNQLIIQKKQWQENNAKQKQYFKNVSQASGKATKKLGTFGTRLKGIALSLFVFQWVTKAFNEMVNAIKEGNQNLAKYSDTYNTSLSKLKSANTQMKNSWATAFAPIAQMAIPHLINLISYVTTAANALARFTALLSGKNTWTKAKAVQEDYAASLGDSADAAKDAEKAMEGYLSPIDEINKYSTKDSSSSSEKSGSGVSAKDMFEEVAIDDTTLAKYEVLKERLKELKNEFEKGFERGNISDKADEVKQNIEDIKNKLIEIYQNPELSKSRKNFEDSQAEMVGTVAGAGKSIGTSFSYGVTEGTKRALDDSEDYIVTKMSSIYDNGTQLNNSVSDLAVAAAEVGTAFESEGFIDIIEFLDKLATVTHLEIVDTVTGLLADLFDLWSKPVTKNATEWKKLLENIFEIISNILEPAKKGLDYILDNGTKYQDSSIHKFLQDMANGNADDIGAGLKVINEGLEKFVDWQEDMKDFSLSEWWENDVSPYLSLERWKEKLSVIPDSFGEKWEEFKTWWKNNAISKWWTEDVEPWFKKETWIEAMTGIKESFNETFKNAANAAIDQINKMIDSLNDKLNISWQPLKIAGKEIYPGGNMQLFKVPNIPRLATGTVVPTGISEFLAVLGDNKREPEVVSPLSTMKQAFKEAIAESGGSGSGSMIINFMLPSKQILAQYAIEGGQVIQTITGANPFELA